MTDLTKKVTTRRGRAARVICLEAANTDYPVIALVTGLDGKEEPESFRADGGYIAGDEFEEHPDDLINPVETVTVYARLYGTPNGGVSLGLWQGSVPSARVQSKRTPRMGTKALSGILQLTYRDGQAISAGIVGGPDEPFGDI